MSVLRAAHAWNTAFTWRDHTGPFACITAEQAAQFDRDGYFVVPVRAGSIVVFTSLTPHHTARNTTDAVRKPYIVQYIPDGAVVHRPLADGSRGAAEPQNDERHQFVVLRDGERVDG